MIIEMKLRSPSMCLPVKFVSFNTLKGNDGVGVPKGGKKGQVLAKTSDQDFETDWQDYEGGSEITIDQQYNPESENAQSGKAVAEAIGAINEELNGKKRTANLFDISKVSGFDVDLQAGIIRDTIVDNFGRHFTNLGKALDLCPEMVAAKTYTFSCKSSFGNPQLYLTENVRIDSGTSFVAGENDIDGNLILSLLVGDEDNGKPIAFSDIMISAEALPYEPYYKLGTNLRVDALEKDVGDISAALDELHAYAQTLVDGGATE